ncbi:acyltransferase family protein [Limosilactobacillus reuteri]|uniref:acyltransferase family protein n=1 Tax=Limosilactobacillus reuteri TaxID=1598 RepID=UPI001CDD4358|nr:acyltransferase family protein [Limosilactobacillus reuteri]
MDRFWKGLNNFLVVVAHTFFRIYTNNIYNSNVNSIIRGIGEILFLFVMPVFFSFSGYLYKSPQKFSGYIHMIKKKAWILITPYVVFSLLYILLNQVGGKK